MATVSINEGWSAILCTKNYWCLAERIKYKLLSLTYKVLTINQPQYPHDLISVQPCHKHVLHLWSLFAACSPTYPDIWKSQIDLFGMLHLSMERTPHWSRASSDSLLHVHLSHMAVHHFHHRHYHRSFSISFWPQELALQQILSSIVIFLSYRTDSTDSRTI